MGATMMLAHFHHCSKGYWPFTENWDSTEAAVRAAGWSAEQAHFINFTTRQIQAKSIWFFRSSQFAVLILCYIESDMKRIREERDFLNDNFFTWQLFDEE